MADVFEFKIFFAQIGYYFIKSWQKLQLIVKIKIFPMTDIFLSIQSSCINYIAILQKKLAKFVIFAAKC